MSRVAIRSLTDNGARWIAVLLSHLLGVEPVPWAQMRYSSAWTGISRLHTVEISGGALWCLESFNRVDHLAPLAAEAPGTGRSPTL